MVQIGDRFKFVPYGKSSVRAQIVSVTKIAGYSDFWCLFNRTNNSETELLCEPHEVPGLGKLERSNPPRTKQHDEISLEEWRKKIRSMR